jgi:hypothetical protein
MIVLPAKQLALLVGGGDEMTGINSGALVAVAVTIAVALYVALKKHK